MTVLGVISALQPSLMGLKLGQLTVGALDSNGNAISAATVTANKDMLKAYINLGMKEIAKDTLLWYTGELITLNSLQSDYTLSRHPVLITDCYDTNGNLRPINSQSIYGIMTPSPKVIHVNVPQDGQSLQINYHYAPDDYSDDTTEVDLPPQLLNSLIFFVLHKCFEMYSGQGEQVDEQDNFKKYKTSIIEFLAQRPTNTYGFANPDRVQLGGYV